MENILVILVLMVSVLFNVYLYEKIRELDSYITYLLENKKESKEESNNKPKNIISFEDYIKNKNKK